MLERMKSARVAIAGLGGLGSNIAVMLARSGIGELLLVDFDRVEASNLNRQTYLPGHLGRFKTDALREQIEAINPSVRVLTQTVRVTDDNVLALFGDYPIVCEAFDQPQSKAMLVSTILANSAETRVVAGSGMVGYASSNLIRTERRMKNLYVCGDNTSDLSRENPPLAPRVMICAAHQANMIIRLILGETDA